MVNGQSYVVVGAALFFLPQMLEYCSCVDNLPSAAPDLLTRLVELLKTFNSRTCQLVLGAGALSLVGLKTISSRNLALASRSLQLIAFFIPLLKAHFEVRLAAKQKSMVKHFDQALKVKKKLSHALEGAISVSFYSGFQRSHHRDRQQTDLNLDRYGGELSGILGD